MSDTNQENVTTQSSGAMEAPLTNQVANMSIHQLYQLLSQMKDLIQQNQQQARQILIANPPLTKTLFQAQIMLGMVRAPEKSPLAAVQSQASQPGQTHTQQVQSIQHVKSVPQAPLQQVPSQTGQLQMPTQVPVQHSQGSITVAQQPVQGSFPFQQPVLSQALSAPLQSAQSFPYQQNIQLHQQPTPLPSMVPSQSQSIPSSSLQAPLQHASAHSTLPLQPPTLSQRPVGPSSQSQHEISQGVGFHAHQSHLSYHTQQHPYQQQGSPQTNLSVPFQQVHPTLPNQAMPQHMFQAGRGPGGVWNQPIPSTGPSSTPQTSSTPQMMSGHHSYTGSTSGSSINHVQGYGQPLAQSQAQPQQLRQPQVPIEAEQQKALLQQVMNLTLEQINSLPPEQRQQVLQLQQAFRSQTG